MSLDGFSIGARPIGPGQPCYIIAEAGSNHDGDLDQALRLIDAAAAARADAVKFQNFRADRLYPPTAGRSDYLGDERSIYDIIRAMEMPPAWLPRLADHARARGIAFLSSTFDEDSVELVAPHVDAFKCASYEMTHTPLLQDMARRGKPLLLSTGTATLPEVGLAVAAARATGNERLVVLQCTASYPSPLASMNVRALVTLREAFDVLTGLSDHSKDPLVAPMAAVALGAVVIEKHFTLDRRLPGPDHPFSIEPGELAELVRRVREVEQALGSGDKRIDEVELELRSFARRSVFSTRPIARGEALSSDNTAVLRCGKLGRGLDPVEHTALLGRHAARDIAAHALVSWGDIAGGSPAPRSEARVELRRATAEDCEAIWRWNNAPDVRRVSFDSEAIPLERHRAWYARVLGEATSFVWVVRVDGQDAGVMRIHRNAGQDLCSIALADRVRGRGVGRVAIALACRAFAELTGRGTVGAHIKPDNPQSARAFEHAGFTRAREELIRGNATLVYEWRAGAPAAPGP
jgi:N-acetylneuraminate synthase